MSKAERVSILLAVGGIAVALLAWLFPQGEGKTTFISIETPSSSSNLTYPDKTEGYQESSKSRPSIHVEESEAPLVTRISSATFLNQIRNSGPDSGKIQYIRDTKHLLRQKLQFLELLLILQQISLDSNKLEVVALLRGQVYVPSEEELKTYGSEFSLSSNRRDAFKLLTGE